MKKTFVTLFLAALLLFASVYAATAQVNSGETDTPVEYSLEELKVAGINPLNGSFFSSLWGNMTSDIDVRMLLHGYDLVRWDMENGIFIPDETVVSGIAVTADNDGNQIFTIVLYPDLYYCDGSQITAWDYAFSMLLTMANEAEEIGGNIKHPEYILGYEEYINGDVPYLAGVRVIDDDLFSITIKADYFPFFYEMGLLSCVPAPISVIAPGVKVADDGRGIYLTNIDGGDSFFTAELLDQTILDEETGHSSHPLVTSGPYMLVSYEDGKAVFEINEYYKGNIEGDVPQIQRLIYEPLSSDELVSAFESGEVGLLHKMSSQSIIMDAIRVVSTSGGRLAFANYPRTGLAFLSFNTEKPIMDEVDVRQALAQLVDKDSFVTETVGAYGLRVDGYYGLGQWMFQILNGAMAYPVEEPGEDNDMTDAEYERQMAEWEELTLDVIPYYEYDEKAAAAQLSASGWNLNASGEAFDPENDDLRYKLIDGELVPLRLSLAYPEGTSAVAGLTHISSNALENGFSISLTAIPMEELLKQYHAQADREFDMYFLALNFDIMFDPSIDFEVNADGIHEWVESGYADEELYEDTVAMRKTAPGDMLEYCKNWLVYQQRLMENLPVLPLYSNVYFDFYTRNLQNYNIASNVTWSQAIIPAFLSELEDETEAEDEFDDEEDFFGDEEFFDDEEFVEFD